MSRPLRVVIARDDDNWTLSMKQVIEAPDRECGFVTRTVVRFRGADLRAAVAACRAWRRGGCRARGECAACGIRYALTEVGVLRFHKRWGRPCAGALRAPKAMP